jgi:hypothetical protein
MIHVDSMKRDSNFIEGMQVARLFSSFEFVISNTRVDILLNKTAHFWKPEVRF